MSSPDSTPRRSGRRRGDSGTRETIARAALEQFSELGYDRATFRSIAAAARVDPALVVHFYGSKEQLFREVTQLPAAVAEGLAALAAGPRRTIGRRLAELAVAAMESPAVRPVMLARIRSASSHPEAARLVRETVATDMARLTAAVTDDRAELRAALIGLQIVGLGMSRYIVGAEPLASMAPAELVDALAPILQRLITGPLD